MDKQIERLIVECKAGQLKAQQQLYERYKVMLFGVCLRYASDRSEAQDLLQEAFIKIYRDIGQYRGEGAFEGWLKKVAVRTALMHFRKKYPSRNAIQIDDSSYHDKIILPQEVDIDEKKILKIVQQLPDGYRMVFNLKCLEEYSYEEIAAELGISESTARSQYARACRQLRAWLCKMFDLSVE